MPAARVWSICPSMTQGDLGDVRVGGAAVLLVRELDDRVGAVIENPLDPLELALRVRSHPLGDLDVLALDDRLHASPLDRRSSDPQYSRAAEPPPGAPHRSRATVIAETPIAPARSRADGTRGEGRAGGHDIVDQQDPPPPRPPTCPPRGRRRREPGRRPRRSPPGPPVRARTGPWSHARARARGGTGRPGPRRRPRRSAPPGRSLDDAHARRGPGPGRPPWHPRRPAAIAGPRPDRAVQPAAARPGTSGRGARPGPPRRTARTTPAGAAGPGGPPACRSARHPAARGGHPAPGRRCRTAARPRDRTRSTGPASARSSAWDAAAEIAPPSRGGTGMAAS